MLLPGPLCSQHLADLGADVIKIENPRAADGTRYVGSRIEKGEASESAMFLLLNRNKKSVTLNIKREGGRGVLLKLLEGADILIEGFRPGTMSEMGIGYEQLHERFPRLVYCAISGYGATGPDAKLAGHDANFAARSGLLSVTGTKDSAPILPGFQAGDVGGGTLVALSGILAALYAREKTGRGQFVDVSMLDGAFNFLHLYAGEAIAAQKNPKRGQEVLSGGLPNYRVYTTKDSRYVMLAALEERFFKTFLRLAGREDILTGRDMYSETDQELIAVDLSDFFLSKKRDDLIPLFENPDTCLSPVNELSEALNDRQLLARGVVRTQSHPRLGDFTTIGSPFSLSETPVTYRSHPPAHGEHTDEVLLSVGYTPEEIKQMRQKREI